MHVISSWFFSFSSLGKSTSAKSSSVRQPRSGTARGTLTMTKGDAVPLVLAAPPVPTTTMRDATPPVPAAPPVPTTTTGVAALPVPAPPSVLTTTGGAATPVPVAPPVPTTAMRDATPPVPAAPPVLTTTTTRTDGAAPPVPAAPPVLTTPMRDAVPPVPADLVVPLMSLENAGYGELLCGSIAQTKRAQSVTFIEKLFPNPYHDFSWAKQRLCQSLLAS